MFYNCCMNKIKLCIFDMDGLLLDTERFAWSIGEKLIAKQYGKEMTDEIINELMGVNYTTYENKLKKIYGEDFPAKKYSDDVHEFYRKYCETENIPLRPGVLKILKFLKNNNILISLGTSTEKKLACTALKNAGIYNYFDFAVYGDEVKIGKPNPEIYLKSVYHFNLKPGECLVFEDTPTGAKSAYDGNIRLILVPDLKKPTAIDKEKAFAIINSLQEAIPIIKKENNIK